MMVTTGEKIKGLINDYEIKLIDPYTITDFGMFHAMLGDVLEFIKNHGDGEYLTKKTKGKMKNWMLDVESVKVINAFTGANIPVEGAMLTVHGTIITELKIGKLFFYWGIRCIDRFFITD